MVSVITKRVYHVPADDREGGHTPCNRWILFYRPLPMEDHNICAGKAADALFLSGRPLYDFWTAASECRRKVFRNNNTAKQPIGGVRICCRGNNADVIYGRRKLSFCFWVENWLFLTRTFETTFAYSN